MIDIIINIIVFVILIILSITVFYLGRKLLKANSTIEKLTKATSVIGYDFDKDMQFLLYLIEYKCSVYINLTLKPLSSIKENKFLTDEDLNNAVEEIVPSILNLMSESYKRLVYKYFSEEGFIVYLTELIIKTITVVITNDNSTKMKSMNRRILNAESENDKNTITFNKSDIE